MHEATTEAPQTLVFNGIDAATGEYLFPPMTAGELLELLEGAPPPPAAAPVEKRTIDGVDRCDPGAAGWGVVFPENADPAVREVREALEPLIEHRRRQAGSRFGEYTGEKGYREGEPPADFLDRLGVAPGPVDPAKHPYYLLLVGDPTEIPFEVQYQLGLSCAVGRLSFERPEEYASYARTVLEAERGGIVRPRRATLLGVHNQGDEATRMSCHGLVEGLGQALEAGAAARNGWEVETHLAGAADKARFRAVLGGPETPALAFTAGHGVGYPCGDRRQRDGQGALVCQDWPGPGRGPVHPEQCFAAADLGSDARPAGLIAFHFACYGAGAPAWDSFSHRKPEAPRKALAPEPLVARLPQRLLGHPDGGALAAIGHVDRAWAWSFVWRTAYQIEVFQSTLAELLAGFPVGAAMARFGERHGQVAARLTHEWQRRRDGAAIDEKHLVGLWTAHNDAQAYVILGDPAVRLAVEA